MTVKLKFLEMVQRKERQLGRRISYAEIAEATGMTRAAVSKWASGEIVSYRKEMLDAFCKYFECQPGDLLTYEPDTLTA